MNSKHPISYISHIHLLFYALIIFLTVSTSLGSVNERDYRALHNIKSMITHGALTSWNNSVHFCNWSGVTCGKRHKRVTYIALESQGLEGSLSPHVGNLSFLRGLSLFNNTIQGAIPHELSHLSRLRFLYLGLNKFNGVIPINISACSNLEEIDLASNMLFGSIPKEIGFLSKLTFLSVQDNKLTGGIPPFLGNITSIEELSVKNNLLGGSIPDTLGHWNNLRLFTSGSCNLHGTIPYSLYNLSLLIKFSLADNQLTGSLPPTIGSMLSHLVILQLYDNHLTGPLPTSISNCSRLRILEMQENKFSGKLQVDFSELRDISFISLYSNNFGSDEADEMKFIDSLRNCTILDTLDLHRCMFQGVLPSSIGNLSDQLRHLLFTANQLHGNIPISIGNLVGLEMLSLGANHFTGNIPSTIGKLQNLGKVGLLENKLSGQIPDTIGNLSSLITLYLSSNMLEGIIPSSLGNCQNLLELYLNDNKLNGRIPKQLLQLSSLTIALDLSQNNMFGSLPTQVGELKMLSELDLSYNNLSGNIPSTIGDCVSLSWLSLEGNLFQGTIPSSLVSLKGLVELDISHNNLTGQIPQFLERLQHLNMSYNDFEGKVPMLGVFANVSAFSVLGNSRLCGGIVEVGLPKCKEEKKKRKKNKFPLFIIVILIALALLILMCLAYAWYKKKSKSQPSQSSRSEPFLKVSYNQLLKATNGFCQANLIGNGGHSSVYKGILEEYDDRLVAIKVLHLKNQGAQRSFIRECEAWQNIRHRNLLKIITSCSSVDFQGNDFKALVYEFMPNGSLDDWLHSSESTSKLNLLQIINILVDVASALDYIHNHCIQILVHGDLKPSNILLDDDMVAHVGDFGLARFLGPSYRNSSTGIRGTIGYVAPEYGLGNEMTSSGDVYSFGILLLEVMTGKKPTDDIFNEGFTIHKFASLALPDHLMDVIDVNILNVYQEDATFMRNEEENVKKIKECLALTVKIGVSCTMDSPLERMDMKNVVRELQHILKTLQYI